MLIRLAQDSDLQAIYDLGFDSYSEKVLKGYGTVINKEKIKEVAATLVRNKTVFVMIDEVIIGVMVGALMPIAFCDEVIYTSLLFFMHPDYRGKAKEFIDGIAKMLKDAGIKKFAIGNPAFNHDEAMDRYYQMMNFRKLETYYLREV